MSQKANLVVDQGATYSVILTLENDDDTSFNLSSYIANGMLRKYYSSSNSIPFDITLGGANGTIQLQLGSNVTSNLVAGKYVYDVEITSNTGFVTRVLEGTVTVTPEVTR